MIRAASKGENGNRERVTAKLVMAMGHRAANDNEDALRIADDCERPHLAVGGEGDKRGKKEG